MKKKSAWILIGASALAFVGAIVAAAKTVARATKQAFQALELGLNMEFLRADILLESGSSPASVRCDAGYSHRKAIICLLQVAGLR